MMLIRKKIRFCLTLLAFSVLLPFTVTAQDEDYFDIEEPEEIPEPYYDDAMEPEPPPEPPIDEPGFIPPPVRPQGGGVNFRGGGNPSMGSGGNRLGTTTGEIEFRLVDPPLYWVGDRRPPLKPPAKKK